METENQSSGLDGFVNWMQQRWKNLRNLSQGAAVTLENTGNHFTATFDCAVKLRELTKRGDWYSEKNGYPRFVIPTQELNKAVTALPVSIALTDTAFFGIGKEGVTKPCLMIVIRPREYHGGSEVNALLQRPAIQPTRVVRERGTDEADDLFSKEEGKASNPAKIVKRVVRSR